MREWRGENERVGLGDKTIPILEGEGDKSVLTHEEGGGRNKKVLLIFTDHDNLRTKILQSKN